MKNICIGIISYLPDDENIRKVRLARLTNLLNEIDTKLELPIIVIAQNWKGISLDKLKKSRMNVYSYDERLGITNARIKLRQVFLNSVFSHIILIDDDLELGTIGDCKAYLNEIEQNQADYYYVDNFLSNYCCISKAGFNLIQYDKDVSAENGTGYEDWIFDKKCRTYLQNHKMISKIYNKIRRAYLDDAYSTWTPTDKTLKDLNEKNSRVIINSIKK